MANEITVYMPSKPATAQFIAFSETSQWFNTGTSAYESYNASNIADYGNALTQVGATPFYVGTVPAGLPDGVHSFYGFETAGALLTVADLDNLRGMTERFDWPRTPLGTLATTVDLATTALAVAALGSPMQSGEHVQLATVQDQYAPARAGDEMALTGAYDAAKTAASQTSVDALPTAAQIVDAILAGGDIDGFTLAETWRLVLAIAVGKLGVTDGGNTNTFRAADDSKDRVVATVNSSGERTAIVLDATP